MAERTNPYEVEEAFLWAMNNALEKGYIRALKYEIETRAFYLRNSDSVEIRDKFSELLKKANEAFRIENEYGSGCLLDLDNPIVARLIEKHVFPSEEVNAAQKYRSMKSITVGTNIN